MSTLTLTHTAEGGTILEGTSKDDGSGAVLKTRPGQTYWKWSRNIGDAGAWYIPRTRDARPNRHGIEATAAALRAADFTVDVEIDDAARPTEEVVADRLERAADRADALEAKAERHAGHANGRFAAEHEILDQIPMGQPILVDHYSAPRHRRALAKAETHRVKGMEHHAIAKDAAQRAESARQTASGREARSTVANRVTKLAADVARDLRALHGHWRRWGESQRVELDEATGRYVLVFRAVDPDSDSGRQLITRIRDNTEARHYWAGVLAAMPGVDPDAVKKGDAVRLGNRGWYVVQRVNRKTFSLLSGLYAGHTLTYRKEEITGHRPAGTETPTPIALDSTGSES